MAALWAQEVSPTWIAAQEAAGRGEWPVAASRAAAAMDWTRADATAIAFLAGCALRAGDTRLAAMAVQQGVLRFPNDLALRRLEVTSLFQANRPEDVRQALRRLLALEPDDGDLWRTLAWAAQATGHPDESLAALEIAVACLPQDPALRRSLAEAQATAGQPQPALIHWQRLMTSNPASAAILAEAAARTAGDAGRPDLGLGWLAEVPKAGRTRSQQLLTARLALQGGSPTDARAALAPLIAAGEDDAQILLWAGHLAEQAGQDAEAEACYRRAANRLPAATLRLVGLCLRQDRHNEAAVLLAAHLAAHPDDAQARAMQAAITGR